MRDLTAAHAEALSLERDRVPHEGLGAEILGRQQPDGSWRRDDAPVWKTTLFTMQLLRATGIGPANPAVKSAAAHLEAGLRWNNQGGRWELRALETGGNTFFQGEVEPCINGGVLALAAYFGRPTETLARRLVDEQLEEAAGIARRRRALAPRSTRLSAYWRGCSNTSVLSGPLPRSCPPDGWAKNTCYSAPSSDGFRPARLQIRSSSCWRSHLAAITTYSAGLTISGLPD